MNTKTDCINCIYGSLTRTARWREGLKKKYPSDDRLGRAAETLTRLANESHALSNEEFAALNFNLASERWMAALSQASREVAFSRNVRTFPEFVQSLISVLSEDSVAA